MNTIENKEGIVKKFEGKKRVLGILLGFGILVGILLIFAAGVFVGFRKARFSYQWGENYHQMFGGPRLGDGRGSLMRGVRGDDYVNSNGLIGTVVKFDANSSTLYLVGSDKTEKSVVISSSTLIQSGRNSVKPEDLKVDDKVVVLGAPSSTGQIEAKLIRIFKGK